MCHHGSSSTQPSLCSLSSLRHDAWEGSVMTLLLVLLQKKKKKISSFFNHNNRFLSLSSALDSTYSKSSTKAEYKCEIRLFMLFLKIK